MITYSALLLPELAWYFLGLACGKGGWIYDTNPCQSEINFSFFLSQRDVM